MTQRIQYFPLPCFLSRYTETTIIPTKIRAPSPPTRFIVRQIIPGLDIRKPSPKDSPTRQAGKRINKLLRPYLLSARDTLQAVVTVTQGISRNLIGRALSKREEDSQRSRSMGRDTYCRCFHFAKASRTFRDLPPILGSDRQAAHRQAALFSATRDAYGTRSVGGIRETSGFRPAQLSQGERASLLLLLSPDRAISTNYHEPRRSHGKSAILLIILRLNHSLHAANGSCAPKQVKAYRGQFELPCLFL